MGKNIKAKALVLCFAYCLLLKWCELILVQGAVAGDPISAPEGTSVRKKQKEQQKVNKQIYRKGMKRQRVLKRNSDVPRTDNGPLCSNSLIWMFLFSSGKDSLGSSSFSVVVCKRSCSKKRVLATFGEKMFFTKTCRKERKEVFLHFWFQIYFSFKIFCSSFSSNKSMIFFF